MKEFTSYPDDGEEIHCPGCDDLQNQLDRKENHNEFLRRRLNFYGEQADRVFEENGRLWRKLAAAESSRQYEREKNEHLMSIVKEFFAAYDMKGTKIAAYFEDTGEWYFADYDGRNEGTGKTIEEAIADYGSTRSIEAEGPEHGEE